MRRKLLTLSLSLVVAASVLVAPAVASAAPLAPPPTPIGLPVALEPLATDVGDVACDPHTRTGTAELAALLVKTYPNTSANTVYACATDSKNSEHYDGRAIDWMVSARTTTGLATANSFLAWLLATDSSGNKYAMARRLGVMYVIFNNRIWGTWDQRWDPYQDCATKTSTTYDSYCHRNHVHISLGWNGAFARTSYWTKRAISTTDYGPCRPADLNWASRYVASNPAQCPRYAVRVAPPNATALLTALVSYSGARVGLNDHGPIVITVQYALGYPNGPGTFGPITRAAVLSFQLAHGIAQSGLMDQATWRALLVAKGA
jgi:hypothetical protein